MKPTLIIFHGSSRIMEIPATYGSLGLGTAAENDIRLVGEDVRPYHLVIRRRGRQWYAISRGEGTIRTAGGLEARQLRLGRDEKIVFGRYSLELTDGTGSDGTSTAISTACVPAGGPAHRIRLTVTGPGRARERHEPLTGRMTIGRDSSNTIVLTDGFCSGHHAVIEWRRDGWTISDLGSKNGISVDGRRVESCRLEDGSSIVIGKTSLLCEFPGSRAEADFLETPGIADVVRQARSYARADFPVLVTGESGSGKEVIAQLLHRCGPRSSRPCLPVNCGAIPETLAESLLFGHTRGAFTGASESVPGFVGASDGGTLVLDEVGELPFPVQAKLLRLLDRGVYMQVGNALPKMADVRVVSCTNRNLLARVRQGLFREDLYHRLAVLSLEVPPLRDRPGDIEPLSLWILRGMRRAGGWNPPEGIDRQAVEKLRSHRWPGNVRELRNVLARAAANAGGRLILPEHVDFRVVVRPGEDLSRSGVEELRALMESTGWTIAAAARRAGIPRTTLRHRLRKSGLARPELLTDS
jgi:transcriptional regulator with AAA-type ATPase domain